MSYRGHISNISFNEDDPRNISYQDRMSKQSNQSYSFMETDSMNTEEDVIEIQVFNDKKKKVSSFSKYSKIFHIYIKLLMGRKISSHQNHFFQQYLEPSYSSNDKKKNPDEELKINIQEQKLTYITELDYNMGDIIVSFPNPDYEEIESIDELNALEAIEFCKAAFCSKKSSSDWETIDNLLFLKAIEQAYLLLMKKDQYDKLQKKKRREMKIENEELQNIQEQPEEEKEDEDSNQEDKPQLNEDLYYQNEQVEVKKENDEKKDQILENSISEKNKNSPLSSGMNFQSSFRSDSKGDEDTQKHSMQKSFDSRSELFRSGGQKDPIYKVINEFQMKLASLQTQFKKIKQNTIKEALNIDYKKLNNEKQRIMAKGEYLIKKEERYEEMMKRIVKEERIQEKRLKIAMQKKKQKEKELKKKKTFLEDDDDDEEENEENKQEEKKIEPKKYWVRSYQDTKDFLTLVRNIVKRCFNKILLQFCIVAGKLGFQIRQFVSRNDELIYYVLYQCDENLKIIAQKHHITKKLNFQFSDLLSLEPIDQNNRPLRLNNRLWRTLEYSENQLSKIFLYLKPKILDLLEKINYKLIAKEVNISQLNISLFSEGQNDLMHDEEGPSDEVWMAYYSYLDYLYRYIEEARQIYKVDNDTALLINKQKTPYELYISRNKKNLQKLETVKNIQENDLEVITRTKNKKALPLLLDYDQRDEATCDVLNEIFDISAEYKQTVNKFDEAKTFLNLKKNKQIGTKHIKVCKKEKLAWTYFQIFSKAIEVINYKKQILKTIWNIMEIDPFEPYVVYTITSNQQSFHQKNKLNSIWRKYQVCETGKISLFSPMERIKINNLCLQEKINFNVLYSKKVINQVFCLNDEYELFGKSNSVYFQDLFEQPINPNILLKRNYYELLHQQIQDLIKEKLESYDQTKYLKLSRNSYQQSEFTFVEPKIFDLSYVWRFQISQPWFVPTEAIKNYYGEKISLYFTFLGYYTKMLLPVGILGLGINIFQILVWDNYSIAYVVPTIIFGFIQIQWCNLMFDLWQQKEQIFAIQFGQLDMGNQQSSGQRADFSGEYIRSISNDQMNSLSYPDWKRFAKMLLAMCLLFFFLSVFGGIMIGLFFLTEFFDSGIGFSDQNSHLSVLMLEITIPAFIHVFLLLILDEFYEQIAEELTNFENHETIEDYEMNFVFKKFFLTFLSMCGPLLEISFTHEMVGLNCVQHDCYRHSQYHFSTIFIIQFSLNIWEIAKPKIMILLKKRNQQLSEEEQDKQEEDEQKQNLRYIRLGEQQEIQEERVQVLEKFDMDDVADDPLQRINDYIENEAVKESYVISPERYGTVDDYMEIILQYSLLALFGMSFPMSLFIAFLWNVLELQTDKMKLLNYMQRPLPLGERSIGVWNGILELLSYLSLMSNTGLISFMTTRILDTNESLGSPLAYFLLLLIINFFLRFMENSIFGEISYQVKGLMKRHVYLLKSTIDKFRSKGQQVDKDDDDEKKQINSSFPIYKQFGCVLTIDEEENKFYEDVSSEDDIEDHYKYSPEEIEKFKQIFGKRKKLTGKQLFDEKLSDLMKRNQQRKSDWALRFKIMQKEDPILKQKTEKFFETTLQYQRNIERLTSHKKIWNDDKINERHLYLRRNKVLIRNLDWRKIIVLKNSYQQLSDFYFQKFAEKHQEQYQHLIQNQEFEQNQVELEELIEKGKHYILKHSNLSQRKVIVFKIKGIWQHQARIITKKQNARFTIQKYKKMFTKYKQISRGKNKVLPIADQYKELMRTRPDMVLRKYTVKDVFEIFGKFIPEQKRTLNFNLPMRKLDLIEQCAEKNSDLFFKKRKMALKCSTIPLKIEVQNRTAAEEHVNQYFFNELSNGVHKKEKTLHLLKILEYKRNLSQLNLNIFTFKQDTIKFLCAYEDDPSQIKQTQQQIFLFTEIEHHRDFYQQMINRVFKFYQTLQDPKYTEMNTGFIFARLKETYFGQKDLLNQIDDILSSGYYGRSYGIQGLGYFFNGLTLRDIFNRRKKLNKEYRDDEMLDFLGSSVKALGFLENEFGLYHGNLNMQNYILIYDVFRDLITYSIIDVGHFYYYDADESKTYFLKGIQPNEEMWFHAPEILYNHQNPSKQLQIQPQKCDIYSLSLICFEMMTLGKFSKFLEEEIKVNKGDIQKAIIEWIIKNKKDLDLQYPMTTKFLIEMSYSKSDKRPFPTHFAKNFMNTLYNDEQIFQFMYPMEEFLVKHQEILNQYIQPKITTQKVVKILGETKKQNQKILTGSQISLTDYLKQSIHKIIILQKLKLYDQLFVTYENTEKDIIEQYLAKMPYQDRKGDLIDQIGNYFQNQFYELIQNPDRLKEINQFLKLLFQRIYIDIFQINLQEALIFVNVLEDVIQKFVNQLSEVLEQYQIVDYNNNKAQGIQRKVGLQNEMQLYEYEQQKKYFEEFVDKYPQYIHHLQRFRFKLQYMINHSNVIVGILHFLSNNSDIAIEHLQDVYIQDLQDINENKKMFNVQEAYIPYTLNLPGSEGNTIQQKKIDSSIVNSSFFYQIVKRLQLSYLRAQVLQDINKDDDFNNIISELQYTVTIMQTKVKMGQVTVNWDNLSEEMYLFITSSLKDVSQQLKFSFLGYLKHFQVSILHMMLQFDIKRKDFKQVTLIQEKFNKLNFINCLYSEISFLKTQQLLVGCYFQMNSNQFNEEIVKIIKILEQKLQLVQYFNVLDLPGLKVELFMILFYLSNYIIYYNSEELSVYINGLIHYVEKDAKIQSSKIFTNLFMIFLYHLQIMQSNYDPCYHQTNENQVLNELNLNSKLKQSNLSLLKKKYKQTFDILGLKDTEQEDENTVQMITWLHQEQLDHYKYDLFQGYIFACSGLHVINLSPSMEQITQIKIVQQLMKSIETSYIKQKFTNINNYIEIELNQIKLSLLNQKLDQMMNHVVKLQELIENGKQSKDFTDQQKSYISNLFYFPYFIVIVESTLLYLIFLYFYFSQQTIKNLWKSQAFQWILNQSSLKHEIIIENTLIFLYYIQQYSLGVHCIQICQQLIELKAPIFLNSDKSFKININVLQLLFLHQDKQNLQKSLQNIFSLQEAYPLEYILYCKQLDLNQMAQIEEKIFQKDISELPFEQQIVKIKLGLKLVLQQIATDQYDKAEQTYGDCDSKIFEIYLSLIKKALIKHQNLKLFTPFKQGDLTLAQVIKLLRLPEKSPYRYEIDMVTAFETRIIPILIETTQNQEIRHMQMLKTLFLYAQSLSMIIKAMKGEMETTYQLFQLIIQIQQKESYYMNFFFDYSLLTYFNSITEYVSAIKIAEKLEKSVFEIKMVSSLIFENTLKRKEFSHVHQQCCLIKEYILDFNISYFDEIKQVTLQTFLDFDKLQINTALKNLECKLQTPETLCEIVGEAFKWQEYIQVEFGSNSLEYASIMKLIAQMYTSFVLADKMEELKQQLSQDQDLKIKNFLREQKKLTIGYLEANVNGKCTPSITKTFREKIRFIKSQIKILQDLKKEFNVLTVTKWSQSAAEDSYQIYQQYCQQFKQDSIATMAHLKIIMADNNIYSQKIMMANDLLLEAEKILNSCYTQKNHPDYAKIYYKFGVMRQNIKKAFIIQATVLLGLEKLTSSQKLLGLKLLLSENDNIRKIFDNFRNHGFIIFLEQKLKVFLESQGREQPKRIRTDHKELEAMIEMDYPVQEVAEKSIIIMQREKIQLDFHGSQWFEKSMQLCKILFSEDNPFYQQVKEQFEATRKIGRAKKRF